MTTSAESRGVTMRVSRVLRDFIQHIQRTEAVEHNRRVSVVEASETVCKMAQSAAEGSEYGKQPKEDTAS